ncbi:hypothetical protein CYMTET_23950 [Cymbomonas tetramitiformis]|uniref:Uncharacterized protein n=1 Tax=Cymbomonas tetramitiformis TaxID=36881 RepID=A0AAE0FXN6_9CHLO|nr:hypothetical protein CYMTET_23950 [Cymbomonas tetramitiformis]
MGIEHDPGPEGDSGEGESVIVNACLVYFIVFLLLNKRLIYKLLGWENEDGTDCEQGEPQAKQEPSNSSNLNPIYTGDELSCNDEQVISGKTSEGQMTSFEVTTDQKPTSERKSSLFSADGGRKRSLSTIIMGEPVAEFQDEDKKALENWEQGDEYNPTPEFRENFIKVFSCGLAKGDVNNPEAAGPAFKALFWLSGVNWFKVGSVIFVFYLIYLFLVMLALMGTGFKLLGGKDSAKMFDVVDNPISGLMIGVLATVLVQSSSTTTSIIIGLVGADEMSVETAIPMIMGANIGTSVTNTLVAMGHFANPVELRRGFAGATVHDVFNMLSVIVILPLQWASNFLGHLTYEMVKDTQACEEDSDTACEDQDFIKPFIKPYSSGVASYDKKIADYVAQGFCDGQCADSSSSNDKLKTATEYMCNKDEDGTYKCDGIDDFENSWLENDVLKEKRLPGYMQFKSSNIAEYFYACPIKDCNVTLGYASEFWDETSNSVNPEAAGLFNGTAQATGQVFEVCHKMKVDLCDADLLKDVPSHTWGQYWNLCDWAHVCVCQHLECYSGMASGAVPLVL